jgi:cell division transport system permease protein
MRYGLVGFLRNGFVSMATMFIMTITLATIGSSMFVNAALDSILTQLEDKVDINVYFVPDAKESDVLALKERVEALPEVREVLYVSRAEELEKFKERHQDSQLLLRGLDLLDENPLGSSIAVRAKETSQYAGIANFLESETAVEQGEQSIIEKVNFFENQAAIEKLTSITHASKQFGFAMTVFLVIASVAIVFNTIRLAIYTSRDEITVMQLVGASNWYVRGPFVIEGALYGFVAGVFVFALMYPVALWLGPASEAYLGTFSTSAYYETHVLKLFGTLVGSGIVLGALSSFLAISRYLKV